MKHPVDNLVRLQCGTPMSLRAVAPMDPAVDPAEASDPEDLLGNTIFGHFAVFNTWTEIHSWFEGDFLERIAPGAFVDTFSDPAAQIRLMFEHGNDPMIGNKPLGAFSVLREDKTGAYYEADLFDAEYVCQLKPALAAGQLGASFRFTVTSEEWVTPKKATEWNPAMLDERTITGVRLFEAGPVVFGAYPQATAGLRSSTDHFLDMIARDADSLARFIERVGPRNAAQVLTTVAGTAPTPTATDAGTAPESAQRGRPVTDLTFALATVKATNPLLTGGIK